MKHLYVNGKRVVLAELLTGARAMPTVAETRLGWPTTRGQPPTQGQTRAAADPLAALGAIGDLLRYIRPEHIQEMVYRDCLDTLATGLNQDQALYIQLKPRIVFEPFVDTYSIDGAPPPRHRSIRERNRVLIVLDDSTGAPVADAEVTELRTANVFQTEAGGWLPLAFLPDGLNPLRVRKAGYREKTIGVIVSPRDTVDVMLRLTKLP